MLESRADDDSRLLLLSWPSTQPVAYKVLTKSESGQVSYQNTNSVTIPKPGNTVFAACHLFTSAPLRGAGKFSVKLFVRGMTLVRTPPAPKTVEVEVDDDLAGADYTPL